VLYDLRLRPLSCLVPSTGLWRQVASGPDFKTTMVGHGEVGVRGHTHTEGRLPTNLEAGGSGPQSLVGQGTLQAVIFCGKDPPVRNRHSSLQSSDTIALTAVLISSQQEGAWTKQFCDAVLKIATSALHAALGVGLGGGGRVPHAEMGHGIWQLSK
jgi:hypothetical protein